MEDAQHQADYDYEYACGSSAWIEVPADIDNSILPEERFPRSGRDDPAGPDTGTIRNSHNRYILFGFPSTLRVSVGTTLTSRRIASCSRPLI